MLIINANFQYINFVTTTFLTPLRLPLTMKKTGFLILLISLLAACNDKKDFPDVSGIKVDIKLERFERDFFAIDTNNVLPGLNRLNEKYPVLIPIFLQEILGLDSAGVVPGVKRFLSLTRPIYDTALMVLKDAEPLKKEFEKAFRFVKYYFPDYREPKIITLIGPVDVMAKTSSGYSPDFLRPGFLALSLQFYLGENFSLYRDPYFIDNVAPSYRSRRFSKEYITADGMLLIVDDLFPDKSAGKPLIDQMIERGKHWYLLDKFLPETPDSVKTGFTALQLEWCNKNEGAIWSALVQSKDLHSISPATIQTYLGEGPFTQGYSQEFSPGNMGQWIGWRIVKKFADKNPELTPAEIMRTESKKILEEAKYKPR